jgi:3-phenylpropionate/trans-cinnamate dioxygenase ferredoxin component
VVTGRFLKKTSGDETGNTGIVKFHGDHLRWEECVKGGFIEAGTISGLREGMMQKFLVGDRTLLLAKVEGRFYVTDCICPHLGADLSEGMLHGTVLTCPFHGSRFDIRDGRVVRWTELTGVKLVYAMKERPPRPLHTYPVRIEGDRILIKLT